MQDLAGSEIRVNNTTIFVKLGGSGQPLLLLHGFPETHLMWRAVAPLLAQQFTVVCADLRGYGRSGCPRSAAGHAAYAKREVAKDMVEVMRHLGFERFMVAGHDRGGRVAYRMALDHPASVERILESAVQAIIDNALNEWGTPPDIFPPQVRLAYTNALHDPAHAHAICEEYRAAATIDREHDRADQASKNRITCPLLALWSADGPLDAWYAKQGGALALWKAWAIDVQGQAIRGGHFFPEAAPEQTAKALGAFCGGA